MSAPANITQNEMIGDNVATGVVAIITADGANFPLPAFGPRDSVPMSKGRVEIRSGGFIRASDQMNFNPVGAPYYNHRRGFISATIISQRHTLTAEGVGSVHALAIGRFRWLMSRIAQKLVPASISNYEVVDLIDMGDRYVQESNPKQEVDQTEVRFQIDLVIPPANYSDS